MQVYNFYFLGLAPFFIFCSSLDYNSLHLCLLKYTQKKEIGCLTCFLINFVGILNQSFDSNGKNNDKLTDSLCFFVGLYTRRK